MTTIIFLFLIQSAKTREDRNTKLLELLQIRGCDAFRKIRHVLTLTGHSFLGDLLYEEGITSSRLSSSNSHLSLAYVLLFETNPFPELVVIFPDYALRTSLGTFSILLSSYKQDSFILMPWTHM